MSWGIAARPRSPKSLLRRIELVEPLALEGFHRAIGLDLSKGGVDGGDEIGTGRQDEAEILGAEWGADDFEGTRIGADIAIGRGLIHQDGIDIARGERLDRSTERVEQLYARIGLVAIEHVIDGNVDIGGAGLRADEKA